MDKLDRLGGHSTILGDVFKWHPEALEAFIDDEVKFRVLLDGMQQGKFFVEIWNSKKKVSFAYENTDGSKIEVFVDDLKAELLDLGIQF